MGHLGETQIAQGDLIAVQKTFDHALSNLGIAKWLVLSPKKLKAHSQNIFSKLNVHNCVEATNRARELGVV